MKNKEYGSDFHFYEGEETTSESSLFRNEKESLFFSGRVALYNLLDYGIRNYGWKRVGFPSYYCHEVVEFCETLQIELFYYPYNPFQPRIFKWEDEKSNVFINVDFFGISMLDTSFIKKSVIIEDLSNNLLSIKNSSANYFFASLRKQLPIPAGGFCYDSNNNFKSKLKVNNFSEEVALQKLSAMYLKSKYLKGEFFVKDIFRNLYVEAEKSFESNQTNTPIPDIVKTIFLKLSHEKLINKTRNNIKLAKSLFKSNDNFELLKNSQNTEMGLMLLCINKSIRDSFKSYLIDKNIYPAILWPDQKNEIDKTFENRVLFVHADFRYNKDDIRFIINQINNFNKHV